MKMIKVMIGFPKGGEYTTWGSIVEDIPEYLAVEDLVILVVDVEKDKLYHWQLAEKEEN